MRKLKLYKEAPQAVVGWEEPMDRNTACTRCTLREGVRNVCLPAEVMTLGPEPDVLVVVGEYPGQTEDTAARPFTGEAGKYVRDLLKKWWKGRVVLDTALRCAPGKRDVTEKHVQACRGYVSAVLRQARPARIVALGNTAFEGLLGRSPPAYSVEGGFSWWLDEEDDAFPTPLSFRPVYLLPNPVNALRNRFLRKRFEEFLEQALTAPVPDPTAARMRLVHVETEDDAKDAYAALTLEGGGPVTFDTETSGRPYTPEFRVETISFRVTGGREVFVWDREQIENPRTRSWLRMLLNNPDVEKWGQNVKYDEQAVWLEPLLKVDVQNVTGDTRLWRKLLLADSVGKLEVLAELVGMGGHKEEAQAATDAVCHDLTMLAGEPYREPLKSGKPRKAYTPKALRREDVVPAHLKQLHAEQAEPMNFAFRYINPEVRRRYNAMDTVSTSLLGEKLFPALRASPGASLVWERITLPASRALKRMERNGIAVNRTALELFIRHVGMKLEETKARIEAHAPGLNPNSPKQLQELLYDKLRLRSTHETRTGQRSTGEEALEALRDEHPIVGAILDHRHYAKMDGTYARGMLPHIRPDGRIHCSYLIDGAGTGRPSGTDPNLLNIPRSKGSPEGKMARDVFCAPPAASGEFLDAPPDEWELLEADMSQQELRVAAMLSGDVEMRRLFESGVDFHAATAEMVCEQAFGISREEWAVMKVEAEEWKKHEKACGKDEAKLAAARVQYADLKASADKLDDCRSKAKSINFGVWYGKTARSLAEDLGCSEEEAQAIMDAIMGRFSAARAYIASQLEYGRKHGGVWTWWDGNPRARWRPLTAIGEMGDANSGRRGTAERSTWNCLDDETEALTIRGWVRGFDLQRGDVLLTKNATTGALEWQAAEDVRKFEDYPEPLIEFRSKSFHAVSTRNHRWLVKDKHSGADVCKTTEELSVWGDHRIHRTGHYVRSPSTWSGDFAELCGWFLTDGSAPRGKNNGIVCLYQSQRAKPLNVARIDALLSRLSDAYPGKVARSVSRRDELVQWRFAKKHPISALLRNLFPSRTLNMPFLLTLDAVAARRLMDAMLAGDGSVWRTHARLVTRSKEAAEMFQVLCTMCGCHASIKARDMSTYHPTSSLLRGSPKMGVVWVVSVLHRSHVQVTASQRREVWTNGRVWCPIVPNTYFVARRSGHVFITGNTPIQGTAADFVTASLWPVQQWIDDEFIPALPVLTVYDSIIVQVKKSYTRDVALAMRRIMTGHNTLGMPLEVDFKTGPSWGTMKDYKP